MCLTTESNCPSDRPKGSTTTRRLSSAGRSCRRNTDDYWRKQDGAARRGNLIQTLLEALAGLLRPELRMLHRSVKHCFMEPEHQALAEVSDFQIVGGKQTRCLADWQVKEATPHDHR